MPEVPDDPRWPKLLSLAVHEFRTPMTVVAGYIRMLLKDRAGPLNDQQRRLLEEAEKSCGRLSALLSEVSELSTLEAGTAPFNRQPGDLRGIIRDATAQLPPLPDRIVEVDVQVGEGKAPIEADAARLTNALSSVMAALRREIVTSDRLLVRERQTTVSGRRGYEILMGDEPTLQALEHYRGDLPVFDEWRGGCGLSLAVARRVLNAHAGSIWSAPDGHKSGARITLPTTEEH